MAATLNARTCTYGLSHIKKIRCNGCHIWPASKFERHDRSHCGQNPNLSVQTTLPCSLPSLYSVAARGLCGPSPTRVNRAARNRPLVIPMVWEDVQRTNPNKFRAEPTRTTPHPGQSCLGGQEAPQPTMTQTRFAQFSAGDDTPR